MTVEPRLILVMSDLVPTVEINEIERDERETTAPERNAESVH